MKLIRSSALVLTTVLAVSGCGETQDTTTPVATVAAGNNPLLSYVPAGSPYLAGNLTPLPDSVIDTFLARAQPVMDALQSELTTARDHLSEQGETDDQGEKLALALLEELDGKLNRAGMEALGFSLQPHAVFYGNGVFPVMRIELGNTQAVEALLQRLQDKSGITIPKHEFQGVPYWRLSDQDIDSKGHAQGAAYLAILDGHLAFGAFPTSAEDELLPGFLGIEKPQGGDAEQRLVGISQKYGYQPFMTGVLDMHKMADVILNPDPVLASVMKEAGEHGAMQLSDQCKTEIRGIIDQAPRVIMGATDIGPNVIATQYRVETKASLAQELAALVSGIPAIPEVSQRVIELALGIKVGALRDMLRNKASAIAEMPYKCEKLYQINDGAQQLLTQLNQPIPPLVNNFLGIRASLDKIPSGQITPQDASGLVAIHVDKPEMFVGMAQMFLPDLAELDLTPGAPPVQVPDHLLQSPGLVAYAAISKDAIGLSVGAGQEAALPEYLGRERSDDGTVAAVDYDSSASMKFASAAKASLGGEVQPQHASINAIAEAAQDVYKSMAGRNQVRVKFESDGVVVDNRMTFK